MTRTYKYGVFAEMLSQALADNGITQADLANDLGIKQQAVSKWVKGQTRPRPATLNRLALRFGWDETAALTAAAYLGTAGDPAPQPQHQPTVSERMTILESRMERQDQILEEIRARLREDRGSR